MSDPSKPAARGTATPPAPYRRVLDAASDPGLARVVERARWLASLDPLLRQSLPATLAGQCRLANVDENNLVFLVSAPVWKAKLRQYAGTLGDAAAAAGLTARTLVVKVSPELAAPPGGDRAGKPLSQAVRDSLRATAQTVADPELRAQLLRLASLA